MAKQPVYLPQPSLATAVGSEPQGLTLEGDPLSTQVAQIQQTLVDNLHWVQGKDEQFATVHDYYMALAHSVRNQLLQKRIRTAKTYAQAQAKTVYYLSAEFLMGRHQTKIKKL